jgi:hypothetical protein
LCSRRFRQWTSLIFNGFGIAVLPAIIGGMLCFVANIVVFLVRLQRSP